MKLLMLMSMAVLLLLTACSASPAATFPPPEGYSSWDEYNVTQSQDNVAAETNQPLITTSTAQKTTLINVDIPSTEIQETQPEFEGSTWKYAVDKLIEIGIFYKIDETDSSIGVWVNPQFYDLTFDDKNLFVHSVYKYYTEEKIKQFDYLFVLDSRSNNAIGEYTKLNGLVLY